MEKEDGQPVKKQSLLNCIYEEVSNYCEFWLIKGMLFDLLTFVCYFWLQYMYDIQLSVKL